MIKSDNPMGLPSDFTSAKVCELLSAARYQAKTQVRYLVTLAVYLVMDATLSTHRDSTAGPAGSSSPGCLEPAYLVTEC